MALRRSTTSTTWPPGSRFSFKTIPNTESSFSSTSPSSGSENALLGEESEKFEISKSFQELKDSYVQKIKREVTAEQKKPKKTKSMYNIDSI